MKQAALSYFQYPEMVLVPLILFFLFFMLLLIFITRPANIELFKKMEKMPLEEEEFTNERK